MTYGEYTYGESQYGEDPIISGGGGSTSVLVSRTSGEVLYSGTCNVRISRVAVEVLAFIPPIATVKISRVSGETLYSATTTPRVSSTRVQALYLSTAAVKVSRVTLEALIVKPTGAQAITGSLDLSGSVGATTSTSGSITGSLGLSGSVPSAGRAPAAAGSLALSATAAQVPRFVPDGSIVLSGTVGAAASPVQIDGIVTLSAEVSSTSSPGSGIHGSIALTADLQVVPLAGAAGGILMSAAVGPLNAGSIADGSLVLSGSINIKVPSGFMVGAIDLSGTAGGRARVPAIAGSVALSSLDVGEVSVSIHGSVGLTLAVHPVQTYEALVWLPDVQMLVPANVEGYWDGETLTVVYLDFYWDGTEIVYIDTPFNLASL